MLLKRKTAPERLSNRLSENSWFPLDLTPIMGINPELFVIDVNECSRSVSQLRIFACSQFRFRYQTGIVCFKPRLLHQKRATRLQKKKRYSLLMEGAPTNGECVRVMSRICGDVGHERTPFMISTLKDDAKKELSEVGIGTNEGNIPRQ